MNQTTHHVITKAVRLSDLHLSPLPTAMGWDIEADAMDGVFEVLLVQMYQISQEICHVEFQDRQRKNHG